MFRSNNVSRKKQFTYWLQYEAKDCGLMQPPMKDALALDFLKDYLLGEDWYIVNPVNHEQGNTQLVHEILYKYSRAYRKEYNREQKRWSK
jgi:hypothetical protein